MRLKVNHLVFCIEVERPIIKNLPTSLLTYYDDELKVRDYLKITDI